MTTKLLKSLFVALPVVALLSVTGCQQKAASSSTADTESTSDSVVVRKSNFNKDPKQPVEWEVTMKKAPDGTYYRHGESRRYSPGGKLAEKIQYVNNKKQGPRLFYYSEGMVWKEQQYANGELNGDCKKYYRDGKVEAEYSYGGGNPGVGLKEYTNTGKQKPNPSLVVTQNDEIKATGFHRISASITGEGMDRVKKVEFFEGALIDGKYADTKKLTSFKAVSATKADLLLSVPKGTFVNTDLNIVAVVTTKTGLKLVLTTRVHVGVRGA